MIHWIKTKDNKEYPIRFDQESMSLFAINENLSFDDLSLKSMNFRTWPLGQFYRYLMTCFSEPCREKRIEFPYSDIRDFNKWVNTDETVIVQCMEKWIESQPKADPEKKQPAAVKSKSR
jgi:hypothetical protein